MKENKHQYTLFYTIRNGGDGSAYPTFMESRELCRWDQDHMDEGWGESCDGFFTLESQSPIVPLGEIVTKESYWIDNYIEDTGRSKKEEKEFLAEFFPKGLPKFSVIVEGNGMKGYCYNKVYADSRLVARVFLPKAESGEALEKLLNSPR